RRRTGRNRPSELHVSLALTLFAISVVSAGFWVGVGYSGSLHLSATAKATQPDSTPPGTIVMPTINFDIALVAPTPNALNEWTGCIGPWSQAQLDTYCNCWGYGRAQKCWYTLFEPPGVRININPGTDQGSNCVDADAGYSYNYDPGIGAWSVACTRCAGQIILTLPGTTVQPSASVSASVSGPTNCAGLTVYIKSTSCSGTTACSFPLSDTVNSCNFNAPANGGTYNYYACLDENGNGVYTDSWESATAALNVAHVISCGDGLVEGTEVCDLTNLTGKTCTNMELGFTGGTLGCKADCSGFNTSQCTGPVCGDGKVNGNEQCDGTNLTGGTCVGQGYTGGTLSCNAGCTFNTASCTGPVCGNGKVESGEDCDGTNLTGKTCLNIGMGFAGGTLSCGSGCAFNIANCLSSQTNQTAVCGNGIIETGEQCDSTSLNGQTCVGRGFSGGALKCTICNYDTSSCTSVTTVTSTDAQTAITTAQTAITTARNANKNVTAAVTQVNIAITTFNSGDYSKAKTQAEMAKTLADNAAIPQTSDSTVFIAVAGIIIAVGGAVSYYFLKMRPKAAGPAPPPAPAAAPA
ncbi:MAG: hypothetical protein V1887_03940, partial [Candidatus Aenigmatarchaeota archaeon]